MRVAQRRVLQEQVALALSEDREITMPIRPVVPGGDPVALRGIPAVGVRGVGGAIRGTSPHQAIERLDMDAPMVAFG